MIVINVFFHIKKEQRDAYLAAMDVLVSHSQKEAGAQFYNLFADPKDDTKFVIIENWENETSIAAHNESAHFKTFAGEIKQFLVEDLRVVVSSQK